jgi:enoyl-CoA hydratase/carnithine racemase
VAVVTLHRPEAGNPVDAALAGELRRIMAELALDDDLRVLLLAGTGPDFCVGTDPQALAGFDDPAEARRWLAVTEAVAGLDVPTLAAVQGRALGQGLELALACDLRLLAEDARLGLAGLPWDGGTQRLPRLVGRPLALEMLWLGRDLAAAEALFAGLASRVVPAAELETAALALAEELARRAPLALRALKEAVQAGLDLTLAQGLRLEADLYFLLHSTQDRAEGVRAFQEKRRPRFQGR